MTVQGKVAIVTGASSGIGRATAQLLAGKGAKVALVARSVEKLTELARSLPDSIAVPTDMTKEDATKTMVSTVVGHYGRIDILVNAAGQGYDAPLEAIDPVKFRHLFELDLIGPVTAMQAVIPIMRRQRAGAIVNVSSGTSLMHLPGMSPYAAVKRALNALTLTARAELKRDGIAVSVVYPYMTLTDFEANTLKDGEFPTGPEGPRDIPPPDPAEHVAQRILEGIESGTAEVFAHDWMANLR